MNKLITKILGAAMVLAFVTATAEAQIDSRLKVVGKAADLKLLNGNDANTYAMIMGWASAGDGGAQIFKFTPSSALSTNYGVITLTTVPTAQWVRTGANLGGKSPRTQTLTAAAGQILDEASKVVVGAAAAVVVTNVPSITDGVEGQELTIIGTSDSNTISLSEDTSGMIGSALLLGATNRVLGLNDSLTLVYKGTNWIELNFQNN